MRAALVLAVFLLAPAPAQAQAQAPARARAQAQAKAQDAESRRQAAKSLKDAAASAFEGGQYDLALDRLAQAYRIFPSPNLLYNIGRVQAARGRPLEAVTAFEQFLADAKEVPEAARADARAQIQELDKSLGRLVIATRLAGRRGGPGGPGGRPDPGRAPASDRTGRAHAGCRQERISTACVACGRAGRRDHPRAGRPQTNPAHAG